MYRRCKKEFKRCIERAMWPGLDRLAARLDAWYAKRGIPKRTAKTQEEKEGEK